jgi:hypothetical protein
VCNGFLSSYKECEKEGLEFKKEGLEFKFWCQREGGLFE